MLGSRHHMLAIDSGPIALNGLHTGDSEPRHQVRVLAIRLFNSAPPGISTEIKVRAKHMVTAADSSLRCGRRKHACDQVWVPATCHRDRRRKYRALVRHMAMQNLVVKESWNPEPR